MTRQNAWSWQPGLRISWFSVDCNCHPSSEAFLPLHKGIFFSSRNYSHHIEYSLFPHSEMKTKRTDKGQIRYGIRIEKPGVFLGLFFSCHVYRFNEQRKKLHHAIPCAVITKTTDYSSNTMQDFWWSCSCSGGPQKYGTVFLYTSERLKTFIISKIN